MPLSGSIETGIKRTGGGGRDKRAGWWAACEHTPAPLPVRAFASCLDSMVWATGRRAGDRRRHAASDILWRAATPLGRSTLSKLQAATPAARVKDGTEERC